MCVCVCACVEVLKPRSREPNAITRACGHGRIVSDRHGYPLVVCNTHVQHPTIEFLERCCEQQLTQKLEITLEACCGQQLTRKLEITLEASELEPITQQVTQN